MYTIQSVSDEGKYYLINGWYKYKVYWQEADNCVPHTVFKSEKSAKASLTKLLKYMMEEYGNDDFTMVELVWNEKYNVYNFIELYPIKISK